jgi:hypothetical protein
MPPVPAQHLFDTSSMEAATPQPKSVIEQLVEQMAVPKPVPGLELRVVRRGEPATAIESISTPALERSPESPEEMQVFPVVPPRTGAPSTAAPAPTSAMPAAPAPAITMDVNAIVDKVHQTLIRRQQRARERKGLY